MHILEVGKLYHPNRTSWPELGEYNCRSGQHELRLFFRNPQPQEIKAVQEKKAEFAFTTLEGGLLFFLFRFGDGVISWSDSPYCYHLLPEAERVLPFLSSLQERAVLNIILVDAATGIVKAMRVVTMELDFCQKLTAAIREQAQTPWNQTAYDGALAVAMGRYDTMQLLSRAAAKMSVSRP